MIGTARTRAPAVATAERRRTDAIIVGGGHNGLVCAAYLAAGGLSVRVLERRSIVGGAAVTEEFHPGFRNSTASYTVSLLQPKVIHDLDLPRHGLRLVERPLSNFLPLPEGPDGGPDALVLGGSTAETQTEFARFSPADAERLPAYNAMLDRVAAQLRSLVLETPVGPGTGLPGLIRALRLGDRLRRLDLPVQRDLLALFAKSAGDLLEGWFESDPVKAVFGFDSIVGTYGSPYSPGSAYVLLHHVFGEVNGRKGAWGHAVGGMGAITQAMAAAAQEHGVLIETDSPVARVRLAGGRAVGVTLTDGTEFDAPRVIANVNPKLLYLSMLEPDALDPDFLARIRGWKCGSATLRMNVALDRLPVFTARPGDGTSMQRHHQAGIIVAPSLAYMDRAHGDARRDGWSAAPIVEMLIPSTVDDSLAPPGQHVASLFCQHFAPDLPDDRGWDACRDAAAEAALDAVEAHAPGFKASILGRRVLTPLDLEREFGLVGGDIFHGALTLDQLFVARPVLGHGAYRGPIPGLYMCGSGTHPGGGVTGAPGHNAAREVLRDTKGRLGFGLFEGAR